MRLFEVSKHTWLSEDQSTEVVARVSGYRVLKRNASASSSDSKSTQEHSDTYEQAFNLYVNDELVEQYLCEADILDVIIQLGYEF